MSISFEPQSPSASFTPSQPSTLERGVKGKRYTVVLQKLSLSEKMGHFLKIVAVIVGFIVSIPIYLIFSTARRDIQNLFQEFKTGKRKVKVLKQPALISPHAIKTQTTAVKDEASPIDTQPEEASKAAYSIKQQQDLNDKNKSVTFEKTFASDQLSLNGISLKAVEEPDWASIADKAFEEPPFPRVPGKAISAGVVIEEPDGRIWIYEPTNHFGGYEHTFPKGRQEDGLTLQQTALKEAFEECGLQVEIEGYLMDQERTTTVTRYYIAKRIGGDPSRAHWEAANVKLATKEEASATLLNTALDQSVIAKFQATFSPVLEKTNELFPRMLTDVKIINASIGGTTGAKLVEDTQNRKFVQKTAGPDAKIQPDHLRAEYYTNKAYKALGVKVPEVVLYHPVTQQQVAQGAEASSDSELIMLSGFIPGNTQTLEDYFGPYVDSCPHLKEVQSLVEEDFVADCLLANWDVAGLTYDNIRIDIDTKAIWRVDNGSGLDYRAQGQKKHLQFFTPHIQEFNTLRNPKINPQAALLFANMTNEKIIQQIDRLLPKREAFLATIPDHLKEIMTQRFDYMHTYKQQLMNQ